MRDHFRGSDPIQSETIARKRKNIGKTGITSEASRSKWRGDNRPPPGIAAFGKSTTRRS
jgi:hypothetical protein